MFICDAEKHRVVVDSDLARKARYRAWNKPRSVTEKPDLEIASGTTRVEGTGLCGHSIWTFRKANTEFSINELGYTDASEPTGARGELEVSVAGKLEHRAWCY